MFYNYCIILFESNPVYSNFEGITFFSRYRSFKDHHDMHHRRAHPCCRYEFPSTAGRIPLGMKCPECLRPMEKYTTFVCCHEDETTDPLY